MSKLKITVRHTHFVVTISNGIQRALVMMFNKLLITYQKVYIPSIRKMKVSEDRHFYYKINNNTFHYSINLLSTFINRAKGFRITRDNTEVHHDVVVCRDKLSVTMNPDYTDRPHQPPYINKILTTDPLVLADLPTGKGKTYISMRIATELRYKTGVVVLSRYIEKWIGDIKTLTSATDEDIYVVKGRDSLLKLFKSGKKYDFVIFSLSTLRSYIKTYDQNPKLFVVSPEKLFYKLGLKLMLNDEVHQSFHAGYMVTIRINPVKVLSLSATLDHLDKDISNMYQTLYPMDVRCGKLVSYKPYVSVYAVEYTIDGIEQLTAMGPRGYSHVMLEQSIMRRSKIRDDYLKMVLNYVNVGYVYRRKEGEKLLILVQTVALATLLTNYLNVKTKVRTISRYVEEDPYENIINSDITVSTNMSAGAALDIPKLLTVIQTVPMKSLQANIQALGRLRDIPGREVRYYYTYSKDVERNNELHIARRNLIKGMVKEYNHEKYSEF